MMRSAEERPRHTPPLREGVMRSASFGRRHLRQARPRSAVTVLLNAPGLAPLTGFSRSGVRSRYSLRSDAGPIRHFARLSCRGLEACGTVSREGRQQRHSLGPRLCAQRRGPLHVSRPVGGLWHPPIWDAQPTPADSGLQEVSA